jgi:hypothetical protein
MQRVMAAKLTRLTHKVAIWQSAISFAVLAPGGKSGNFWIHNRISKTGINIFTYQLNNLLKPRYEYLATGGIPMVIYVNKSARM